jgi:hypothetical protein
MTPLEGVVSIQHLTFRLGDSKSGAYFGSGFPPVTCFHGPATKRVPFQCQMRVFVPPVGQQRESLAR